MYSPYSQSFDFVRDKACGKCAVDPVGLETDTFCIEGQHFTRGWEKYAQQQYSAIVINMTIFSLLS
jgi:hypothetical protein